MNQSSFNLFYFSCEHFVPPTWFLCTTRYHRQDNIVWRRKLKIFFSLMHLLLIVNSSSNFAIYCLMGNKFRTVFFSKLKRYKRHKSKILFFDSYIERKYQNLHSFNSFQEKLFQSGKNTGNGINEFRLQKVNKLQDSFMIVQLLCLIRLCNYLPFSDNCSSAW